MTASPGVGAGIFFTGPADGDMRRDLEARRRVSIGYGIPVEWATANQVHGDRVLVVDGAGPAGEADGLVTTTTGLPVAVFTADCLGVVLVGEGAAGVAHAGWRGLATGVIEATVAAMTRLGSPPHRAFIGPGIGPCCFEVGAEVLARFPADGATTTWGTDSVDLRSAASSRLLGMAVQVDERCTACGGGPSHRRTGTAVRMAAIGWVP